jgi:hypothetical protein
MDIFDDNMKGPNQYYVRNDNVQVRDVNIRDPKVPGKVTDAGVRDNVSAALSYCAAWISGNGCVPINNLMEDAATAEISRCQLWQWAKYGTKTASGKTINTAYLKPIFEEEGGQARPDLQGVHALAGRGQVAQRVPYLGPPAPPRGRRCPYPQGRSLSGRRRLPGCPGPGFSSIRQKRSTQACCVVQIGCI